MIVWTWLCRFSVGINDSGYSLELPQLGGSNEYSLHGFVLEGGGGGGSGGVFLRLCWIPDLSVCYELIIC